MWQQVEFSLTAKPKGFHLITSDILRHINIPPTMTCGLLHLFIKHTSASLTINENTDPTVHHDLEAHFNQFIPEDAPYYQHTHEGVDDMPAHIKASTLGNNLTIPISHGQLNLGIWQGIYLGEHRVHETNRTLVATIHGE
jgi:secondary thiamine-phosphate synthase enzyme